MSIITHPTYDQIHEASAGIVKNIRQMNIHPDVVVGLVRGGTLPATIISHLLDIPMVAMHYSSKSGAGDDKGYDNEFVSLKDEHRTILFVDDICDTGQTLHELFTHYNKQNRVVYSAVLYYKYNAVGFVPDFYWQKLSENAPWIMFPFETA